MAKHHEAAQLYYEWCRWLDLPHELSNVVLERLRQGGEYLRSLLQFMLCSCEPCGELAEWRSSMAMQTTCMALTIPGAHQMTLAATCVELLQALPRPTSYSLHICTVLQHLLMAHEAEILTLLLHYQAPFVLLRALNRPGCSEVLQILVGGDAMLPKLVPHLTMRPLHVHSLQQVRQYLLAFQWPKYLEAVMAQGAGPGEPSSPRARSFQSPGARERLTPCSTPQRHETSVFESLELQRSPEAPSTPQLTKVCTPPRSAKSDQSRDSPELSATGGVAVLLGFLSSILHAFRRQEKAAGRSEDWESQERAKVQVLLLQDFFIEVPLVSSLCLLVGRVFESASLLNSLLQHALQLQQKGDVVQALAAQCLQRLDTLFAALGLGRSKGLLRLNGYVVREPLGALRSEVVQILSALSRLVPEQLLPMVKPTVWAALANWFFLYRCNHIFQTACSKLWVQVIRHGSPELQRHIFMHLRLFVGLCDAILMEGRRGDRWHDVAPRTQCENGRVEKQQVATCRARHPGGLGAIVQVARELEAVDKLEAPERRPLVELKQTQRVCQKVEEISFLRKMTSNSTLWPQVLEVLPPLAVPVRVAPQVTRSSAHFDV